MSLYLMGYFIWLILSRKSIFGHTIKFLEPGRSSTDQSAFIASEFELRQKIENRCRRLIKIRDIPPPIWIWPTTGFYLMILWLCLKPRSETYRLSSNEFESNDLTLTGYKYLISKNHVSFRFCLWFIDYGNLSGYTFLPARCTICLEYTKNTIFKNYLF